MIKPVLIFKMYFIVALCGCAVSCGKKGLERTSFVEWKTLTFPEMGISLEVPKTGYYLVNDSSADVWKRMNYGMVSFRFHPIATGVFLAEPNYQMRLSIVRVLKQDMPSYLKGESLLFLSYDEFYNASCTNVLNTNLTVRTATVSGRGRRQAQGKGDFATIVRKDIGAPNGDYVLCGAWIFSGEDSYVEPVADIDHMKRMIGSICCGASSKGQRP
jgi:hypothetical protein